MNIPIEYFHNILRSALRHDDEITYLGNASEEGSILNGKITFEINSLVYTFKYDSGELERVDSVHDLDGLELYVETEEENSELNKFLSPKEIDELQYKLEESI